MGTLRQALTWHAAPHARREGIIAWLHIRARASRLPVVLLLAWCALVSHSITLALAALEIVSLPSRPVETMIAASIVYVAVGNLCWRDIRHRWGLTFAFGLIHGFGFASVLREYGPPRDAVGLALAAFNVGVEISQLVIVLAAIVLWRAGAAVARSRDASVTALIERRASLAVSMAVLVAGLYWLGVRLLGA